MKKKAAAMWLLWKFEDPEVRDDSPMERGGTGDGSTSEATLPMRIVWSDVYRPTNSRSAICSWSFGRECEAAYRGSVQLPGDSQATERADALEVWPHDSTPQPDAGLQSMQDSGGGCEGTSASLGGMAAFGRQRDQAQGAAWLRMDRFSGPRQHWRHRSCGSLGRWRTADGYPCFSVGYPGPASLSDQRSDQRSERRDCLGGEGGFPDGTAPGLFDAYLPFDRPAHQLYGDSASTVPRASALEGSPGRNADFSSSECCLHGQDPSNPAIGQSDQAVSWSSASPSTSCPDLAFESYSGRGRISMESLSADRHQRPLFEGAVAGAVAEDVSFLLGNSPGASAYPPDQQPDREPDQATQSAAQDHRGFWNPPSCSGLSVPLEPLPSLQAIHRLPASAPSQERQSPVGVRRGGSDRPGLVQILPKSATMNGTLQSIPG